MRDARRFTVDFDSTGGTLTASISGELDMSVEDELVGAVRAGIDEHRDAAALVLDLRSVDFIDSSGLRAVMRCCDGARLRSLPVALCVVDGAVTRVFDVAGVRDWFDYV